MKRSVALSMAMIVLLACVRDAPAGSVSYPALGNFIPSHGAIEMWIIPQFDPLDEHLLGQKFWGTNLIKIEQDEHTFFNIIWRVFDGVSSPYARHRVQRQKLYTNWCRPDKQWKVGQPRHLAYCWEPGRDWWILDGVRTESLAQELTFAMRVSEKTRIVLGAPKNVAFVIDDLRISSRPRAEHEVGFHHPAGVRPDPWTLLLDTFERLTVGEHQHQTWTTPSIMTPGVEQQQTGGLLSPEAQLAPGIGGTTGLRL